MGHKSNWVAIHEKIAKQATNQAGFSAIHEKLQNRPQTKQVFQQFMVKKIAKQASNQEGFSAINEKIAKQAKKEGFWITKKIEKGPK